MLQEPIELARDIYERCQYTQLMDLYKLPEFSGEIDNFLAVLATKNGKLKKGGYPDMRAAAKLLIQDWSMGKIRFYKLPPQSETQHADIVNSKLKIVGGWSNELDIESLLEAEKNDMTHLMCAEGIGFELNSHKTVVKNIPKNVNLDNSDDESSSVDEDEIETMDQSNKEEYLISSKH